MDSGLRGHDGAGMTGAIGQGVAAHTPPTFDSRAAAW